MMKKVVYLSFACFLLLANYGHAQAIINNYQLLTKNVKQYTKAEWDIALQVNFDNPYLQEDVAVNMQLTAPSGKKLLLPCYYESGESDATSLWKARFMPQEQGKYVYSFQLWKNGKLVQVSNTSDFVAKPSVQKGILHSKNNWVFQFDNGELFRGIGENICWESRASDDSKYFKELHEEPKYNYEYMLRSLAANGGNYFRTWICSWNLPLDWKDGINNSRYSASTAYYHPEAIRKMDRMVELSDSLGLYIMLTMGPGSHDEKNGRYATSTRDFFIDAKARAQYKNRLRFMVARWGFSPAIGAWEFFNEIDNVQFRDNKNPISAESIVQWHDEMSAYLKATDPFGHLITTSISHRDLKGLNNLAAIDFNQKHIYKNNRALPITILQYAADFNKPYVIGEYGYEYDWQKNFNDFAPEMDSDFKRGLWYGLFTPTPVLPLSWWWEIFDNRGTDKYIVRVRTILNEMMKAGKGNFDTVTSAASAANIEIYAVKCGSKTFVYAYNPNKENIQSDIVFPATAQMQQTLRVFDCETGKCSTVKASLQAGKCVVKAYALKAGTDVVFILDK